MTAEHKHTPGPWILSGGEHGEWQISAPDAEGEDGWGIAMTFGAAGFHGMEGEAESEANARLIADAPEMLAMLIALRSELEGYEADASGEGYNNPELNALIAKAQGGAA